MHFQIFIPHSSLSSASPGSGQPASGDYLSRVGLADLVPNSSHSDQFTGPTVEGVPTGPGRLFVWDGSSYFGDNADWLPAVPSGNLPAKRYWVGVHKTEPPKADELKRHSLVQPNIPVSCSGGEWLIPVARNLPKVFGLDPESGGLTMEVVGKHRDYWRRSESMFEFLFGQGATSMPYEDLWDFSLLALSQNYRITPEIVSHLGICTSDTFTSIIRAACDVEAIIREVNESQKKT